MTIRVGVIGIGFMGKTHIRLFAKDPRVAIVSFSDVDERKAAGDWGGATGNLNIVDDIGVDPKKLKSRPNAEDMILDPDVDVVSVTTPTYLHAKYTLKALEAGKHVVCEKPMTMDLKEADAIVAAAKKAKGLMMPAHCMRFWPEWVWLKKAVQEKTYGKVHAATFKRFGATPRWSWNNWLLTPKLSGSALFDLHIHDTDYIRYVFGDPQAVYAAGNSGKNTKDGIDHVVTSYLYKNPKLIVVAEGGWTAEPTYGFTMRYTVVFDKATADFDFGRTGKTLLLHKDGAKEPEVVQTSAATGHEEIKYFLDCLEKGVKPSVTTAADARKSVALVHKELESAQKRKIVKV